MIEVEVGDTIVEFPDGTSPDVMRAALRKRFGPTQGGVTSNAEAKGDLVNEPISTGNILPVARNNRTNELSLAVPGFITAAIEGFKLPGQVASGQVPVFDERGNVSQEVVERGLETAAFGPASNLVRQGATAAAPLLATAKQNLDEAAEFGIGLTRGQASRDLPTQAFEEDALSGARGAAAQARLQTQRQQQSQQVDDAIERITDDVAQSRSNDAFEIAENVGTAVRNRSDSLKRQSQANFDRAEEIGGEFSAGSVQALGQRLGQRLSDENLLEGTQIAPDLPVTRRWAARLQDVISGRRAPDGEVVGVDYRAFARIRRGLNGSSPTGEDRKGVAVLRKELDDWLKDSVDEGLVSGNPAFLDAFQRANSLWRQYKEISGSPKAIVRGMADASLDSVQIANYLYGASKVGGRADSAGVVREIKRLIGESNPAFQDLRRGVMLRLFENARTGDRKGYQRLAGDIQELTAGKGRELAKALYGPESLAQFKRFSHVLRNLTPDNLATNPSRSGQVVSRRVSETLSKIAPFIGFSVGDLTGALGGFVASNVINRGAARKAGRLISKPEPRVPIELQPEQLAPGAALLTVAGENRVQR